MHTERERWWRWFCVTHTASFENMNVTVQEKSA